jgi:hypothetical protein
VYCTGSELKAVSALEHKCLIDYINAALVSKCSSRLCTKAGQVINELSLVVLVQYCLFLFSSVLRASRSKKMMWKSTLFLVLLGWNNAFWLGA